MKKSPLLVLFITIFIDLLGFGIVIPILPNLVKEITSNDIMVGIPMAAFSMMQFLFSPWWGNLSDRLGRRPIILASIAITALAYAIFAFAGMGFTILLISRIVAGFGSANISAAQAYIADITPPADRAKRMGLVGAAFGLGFALGPFLGGWLYHHGGIQLVGFSTAGLCAFNLALALFILPESLKEKQLNRKSVKETFNRIADGLTNQSLKYLFIINFLYIMAFSMMQIESSVMWKEYYGLNSLKIGNVFAFIGISSALVQGFAVGRLSKWFGEWKMLIIGSVISATGLALLPFAPQNGFWIFEFLFLFLIALSNGFITPALNATVTYNAPAHMQGSVLGILQSTGSLARGVGPLLGGFLYSVYYRIPFLVAGGIMIGCLFILLSVSRRKLHEPKH